MAVIESYERFWEINRKATSLGEDAPRVPVNIYLNGDWICDYLGADCPTYYTDYRYQQETRKRCNERTVEELAYVIQPEIDFGVVMDASIYGGRVLCEPKATPVLTPVINDPEEIPAFVKKMASLNLLDQGLLPRYFAWRDNIAKDYGVSLTYGDSIKGCATTLGQLCGITNFLTWVMTDPDEIAMLVDCWLETSVRYIDLMRRETGYAPGAVGKFSFASDVVGMLSPELYGEKILQAEGELYRRYAGGERDRRYYHADYHMLHLLPQLREIGVNEVNIDPYITPGQILEIIPDCLIYGQIPPTSVLLYGAPEEIKDCVRRDIEQAGPGKHLIVCTAGSINPGTSFENLRAVCEAVEEYGYLY